MPSVRIVEVLGAELLAEGNQNELGSREDA